MKKIPTLFKRVIFDHKVVDILDEITPGCEEAFLRGVATVKWDGSCCAIIDGQFYKRYDAKKGKTPPSDAIACCDPDPITGHWPHWVPVHQGDKWFLAAHAGATWPDGTYEAVGKHFNGNPYNLEMDVLIMHGQDEVEVDRTFAGVRAYLESADVEGLVFWLDGKPVCKIKRSDFGLRWPV